MASTTIVWFRQDLRLRDNPALSAAVKRGGAVVPIYIWAPDEEGEWPPGGAAKVWIYHSLASLRNALRAIGSDLLMFKGSSVDVLRRVAKATGADALHWNRRYEPAAITRDTAVTKAMGKDSLTVKSFNGSLLWEPWEVKTKTGGPYQVFTPFWKTLLQWPDPSSPTNSPAAIALPAGCPGDDGLDALKLLPANRWDAGILDAWTPGEAGAHAQLEAFLDHGLANYDVDRNRPDKDGSSRLSPYLHHGELSPRQVWHAVQRRMRGRAGDKLRSNAWAYLREIGWREFAYHLLYHFPHTPTQSLRKAFEHFPWVRDAAAIKLWHTGRTGFPIVDAGMRQLWQTGWMHNRVRMIAASFLVKDLRISWLDGARWFWDTLVDADLANNTLGWQWAGGCGADAAPYFRVFNPTLQGRRFDPDEAYVRQYVPELGQGSYPQPMVDHAHARDAALASYARIKRNSS